MSPRDDEPTRSIPVLTPGTEVGHYRIEEPIGAGGMGEVFLAFDTRLNRRAALKFLPAHAAADEETRTRFTREAQASAALDHPHIVTIYEVGEHDGRPFFAMQYVRGVPLTEHCREKPLPLKDLIRLTREIAEGLQHAHAVGIVHRDVKPANVIVDADLRPRILDFGLATMSGSEGLTREGSTLGTINYMSPEQAQGLPVDPRSDLFSLGVVLYELITGRTPFRREGDAATLQAIVREAPEPLARYKSEVPEELQRIVAKCLAKQADERYQTAADLAADLRAVGRALGDVTAGSGAAPPVETTPSIAVLPFASLSADPENEFFADGLTEEVLNMLARNGELKVTGRTSSFAFKGKQEDLREIGRKLGVANLLEGSVRKAGNRARISAQLVNAEDGFHLWSATFDRVLEDVFAVQDEIAGAVAEALNVTLLGGGSPGAAKVDPEVYAWIVHGKQLSRNLTRESLAEARALFERALEREPGNAAAWAGLAWVWGRGASVGIWDHEEGRTKGLEAARRAVELDPEYDEGHRMVGFMLGAYELDWAGSMAGYRRAHELAPGNARNLAWLGAATAFWRDPDEGTPMLERACELDPLDPDAAALLARAYHYADRYEDAEREMRRVLMLNPTGASFHTVLSWILISQGKLEEAAREVEHETVEGYLHCGRAIVFHVLGRAAESDRAMAELLRQGPEWAFQVVAAHAVRGETDEAFAALETAYDIRDSGLSLTRLHPLLRSLHPDPRWGVYLEKVGLA